MMTQQLAQPRTRPQTISCTRCNGVLLGVGRGMRCAGCGGYALGLGHDRAFSVRGHRTVDMPAPHDTAPVPVRAETAIPKQKPRNKPRKQRTWVLISVGSVLSIVLVGGGVYLAVAGLTSQVVPAQEVVTPIPSGVTDAAWSKDAAWSRTLSAGSVAVTADGKTVAVVHESKVYALDVATGRTIAKQNLGEQAASRIFQTKDFLVIVTKDSAWLFPNAGDAWVSVPVKEVTVMVRGGALFLARTVGSDYELVRADGRTVPVPVPTEGAVPVSATGEQLVWVSAAHEIYVTDHAGKISHQQAITPLAEGAKPAWLGGDAHHVYVSWTAGKKTVLQVIEQQTGRVVASHPLPDGTPDRTAEATRDGSLVILADLLINPKTGRITKPDTTDLYVAGDAVTNDTDLVTVEGDSSAVTDAGSRVLALTPDGLLLSRGNELVFAPANTTH